jgi:hypothetical protein
MKKIQTTLKMQLRIVRAKEFQELLDSVHASEEKDNKVSDGQGKEVVVESYQDKPLISTPNHETPIASSEIQCLNCKCKGHQAKDCRKPKVICFKCGQEGHIRPECPNIQEDITIYDAPISRKCGETTRNLHKDCWKVNKELYGKGESIQVEKRQVLNSQLIPNSSFQLGNQSEEVATTKVHHAPKKSRICNKCGIEGHIKKECRKPKGSCFGCGEPGHKKMNYPNQQLVQTPPTEGSQAFMGIIPPSKGIDEGTSTEMSSGKLHGKRKFESINQDDKIARTSKSNLIPRLSCS